MTGTELEIIPPLRTEIAGSAAERLPEVHTNASTDLDLLAVWLKSHADGSRHTLRAYGRIGRRFVEALAAAGSNLKRASVEDVQNALEAMRTKGDGSTGSAATVNTYVAAVKALLGFAHKVGFTRFNAAPLIKLTKGSAQNSAAASLTSRVAPAAARREIEARSAHAGGCVFRRAARFGACKPHLVTGDPARDG